MLALKQMANTKLLLTCGKYPPYRSKGGGALTAKEWPEVLTINQAAEYLQVAVRTIYRLIDGGDLKAAKVGRVWRVRKVDLDTYLDAQISGKKE